MDNFFKGVGFGLAALVVVYFAFEPLKKFLDRLTTKQHLGLVLFVYAILIGLTYLGYTSGTFSPPVVVLFLLSPPVVIVLMYIVFSQAEEEEPEPLPEPPKEPTIEEKVEELLKRNRDS